MVKKITHLFLDVGGVLLTNGWDHKARKRAAAHFKFQWDEMENRHRLFFELFENGKLSLDNYLSRTVFCQKRPFSRAEFKRFMFAQSSACPDMIELVIELKAKYGLKIALVNNEGRELNEYRIRKFKLDAFADAFISSCFVRVRKPDGDMIRLALDIAHAEADRVIYIENTSMFVDIAEDFGIRGILHTDYKSTRAKLSALGLRL